MINKLAVTGTALIVAAFAALAAMPDEARMPSPAEMLAAAGEGDFKRARLPYPFRFPEDFGSHREYRTETWHLSGILQARDGPRLGLQLAVIRVALGAQSPRDDMPNWASGEIYAALFALSDPGDGELHTAARLARGGIGLADWQTQPMRLWVEDWQVQRLGSGAGDARLDLRLAARDIELELTLRQDKAPVDHNRIHGDRIHGDNGGNSPPFVYYIEPRLEARGHLRGDAQNFELAGRVSIEHAWGELPLPGGPVVQDRFTLYLDDGRELFLVRSHRRDGSGAPTTAGLLIDAGGTPVLLGGDQIELRAGSLWTSEQSGARYPLRWSLRVPAQDIELDLVADRERQEGRLWAPFWAGSLRLVRATGPVVGEGFMQLNGYQQP
jgi:predicted secreted hydrolase